MNIYIICSIGGIVLGLGFGWLIARGRVKRYEKAKLNNLTEKEIMNIEKQHSEEEKFWNNRKEVEDGRKSRTYKDRHRATDTRLTKGEPRTGNEDGTDGSTPASPEREPVQDTPLAEPKPNNEAVELTSVEPI